MPMRRRWTKDSAFRSARRTAWKRSLPTPDCGTFRSVRSTYRRAFADFDDYWSPFLGGQGPAPTYAMSLDGVRRDALRQRIRATLPVALDGAIELEARAWAARGSLH